jgi:hypothetical protein
MPPSFFQDAVMRIFMVCVLVLALDVAFALAGARTLFVPGLVQVWAQAWAGVPLSVWAGLAGIVFLVLLTFAISLFAFRSPQVKR